MTPDAGVGRVLLFGIVFLPVYLMLAGWILGRPRELRLPLIGLGFLAGFTVLAWGGLALLAWGIDTAFFR